MEKTSIHPCPIDNRHSNDKVHAKTKVISQKTSKNAFTSMHIADEHPTVRNPGQLNTIILPCAEI